MSNYILRQIDMHAFCKNVWIFFSYQICSLRVYDGFFLGGGWGVANVDTMSQKILGGFLQVYI